MALSGNRFAALLSDDDASDAPAKQTAKPAAKEKKKGKRKSSAVSGRKKKKPRKKEGVEQGDVEEQQPVDVEVAQEVRASGGATSASAVKAAGSEETDAAAGADPKQAAPLPGGVTVKILRPAPSGAPIARKGSVVQVMYEGRLVAKNGMRFDAGEVDWVLGDGSMVPGFEIGVKGMGEGESRLIFVPSRMGYGKKGKKPKVPPNSDLEFSVVLRKCGIDWGTAQDHSERKSAVSKARREAMKRRGKKSRSS